MVSLVFLSVFSPFFSHFGQIRWILCGSLAVGSDSDIQLSICARIKVYRQKAFIDIFHQANEEISIWFVVEGIVMHWFGVIIESSYEQNSEARTDSSNQFDCIDERERENVIDNF